MSSKIVLHRLIEPIIAGFWGEAEAFLTRKPCYVIRNGDVSKNGYINTRELSVRFFSDQEIKKASLVSGDIILVSSGAYTGNAGILNCYDDCLPVVISNFVRRIRSNENVDAAWLFHLFRSEIVQRAVPAHTGGSAIPNLQSDLYRKCVIPYVPSISTQRRIAEILSTVDEAIEQTECLIAKQQQIKAGLMHDLFTRGIWTEASIVRAQAEAHAAAVTAKPGQLRPPRQAAPELYKNSPLGWIPKDWEVKAFNFVFELPSGQVDPTTDQYRDYILVAPDHIEKRSGRLLDMRSASSQGAISGKYLFRAGDIVYSKIRPYLRKAILADFHGLCSADMYPLRLKNNENRDFYFAFILGEHFSKFAESVSMRSGFPKINQEELSQYNLPYPYADEQDAAGFIIRTISECQLTLQADLAKLQKQKQGLMQDLLTGKVSVE